MTRTTASTSGARLSARFLPNIASSPDQTLSIKLEGNIGDGPLRVEVYELDLWSDAASGDAVSEGAGARDDLLARFEGELRQNRLQCGSREVMGRAASGVPEVRVCFEGSETTVYTLPLVGDRGETEGRYLELGLAVSRSGASLFRSPSPALVDLGEAASGCRCDAQVREYRTLQEEYVTLAGVMPLADQFHLVQSTMEEICGTLDATAADSEAQRQRADVFGRLLEQVGASGTSLGEVLQGTTAGLAQAEARFREVSSVIGQVRNAFEILRPAVEAQNAPSSAEALRLFRSYFQGIRDALGPLGAIPGLSSFLDLYDMAIASAAAIAEQLEREVSRRNRLYREATGRDADLYLRPGSTARSRVRERLAELERAMAEIVARTYSCCQRDPSVADQRPRTGLELEEIREMARNCPAARAAQRRYSRYLDLDCQLSREQRHLPRPPLSTETVEFLEGRLAKLEEELPLLPEVLCIDGDMSAGDIRKLELQVARRHQISAPYGEIDRTRRAIADVRRRNVLAADLANVREGAQQATRDDRQAQREWILRDARARGLPEDRVPA